METFDNNTIQQSSLEINEEIKSNLITYSKWSAFLSILGFIGIGFMVLAAFGMFIFSSFMGGMSEFGQMRGMNGMGAFGGMVGFGWIGFFYLILAAMYFFPIYYLLKSSIKMKRGINASDQLSFNLGFHYLKSHYKFIGIFTIVIMSLYILLIFAAMIMSVARF